MSKNRITRYLERRYQDMSKEKQEAELKAILGRLENLNFLSTETLISVIDALQKEEGWPLWKILAHLDMIDIQDRM